MGAWVGVSWIVRYGRPRQSSCAWFVDGLALGRLCRGSPRGVTRSEISPDLSEIISPASPPPRHTQDLFKHRRCNNRCEVRLRESFQLSLLRLAWCWAPQLHLTSCLRRVLPPCSELLDLTFNDASEFKRKVMVQGIGYAQSFALYPMLGPPRALHLRPGGRTPLQEVCRSTSE